MRVGGAATLGLLLLLGREMVVVVLDGQVGGLVGWSGCAGRGVGVGVALEMLGQEEGELWVVVLVVRVVLVILSCGPV